MIRAPLCSTLSPTRRSSDLRFDLAGRASVFDRVTDFAYVPRDSRLRVDCDAGGEFALPMAVARQRLSPAYGPARSEEHTSELQSRLHLVCRLLLEHKNR